MNCREYQHQITLLLYEEIPDAERPRLEAHLRECSGCKAVYESEKDLYAVLAEDAARWDDIPSDLLVESRRHLSDALDSADKKRSWWRIPTFSVVFTPMRMLESAALVAMGLALGVYVSGQQQMQVASSTPASISQAPASLSIPSNASISNLRIVDADTNTGHIELAGEVLQPLRLQGKMDDDIVRRLLLSALRDETNPGSRLQAVEVLAQKPDSEPVEEALIHALVNDGNPAVRMRALEGLKRLAAEEHVRAALIHTLSNEDNAGIRVQAIEALTTISKDRALAKTIEEVTKEDDNPYVRMKALQFVGMTR